MFLPSAATLGADRSVPSFLRRHFAELFEFCELSALTRFRTRAAFFCCAHVFGFDGSGVPVERERGRDPAVALFAFLALFALLALFAPVDPAALRSARCRLRSSSSASRAAWRIPNFDENEDR
tara:strand:- start:983 stop:1351 length:369 start_codon:yes stop_codon:yes gene_type:complete